MSFVLEILIIIRGNTCCKKLRFTESFIISLWSSQNRINVYVFDTDQYKNESLKFVNKRWRNFSQRYLGFALVEFCPINRYIEDYSAPMHGVHVQRVYWLNYFHSWQHVVIMYMCILMSTNANIDVPDIVYTHHFRLPLLWRQSTARSF